MARLLVAVIVMVAASCGDDANTQVTGASSTAEGETGSQPDEPDGQPLDLSGGVEGTIADVVVLEELQAGPLEAGTYTLALFGHPVTLEVPDGWHLGIQLPVLADFSPVQTSLLGADPVPLVGILDLSASTLVDPPYPPNVIERLGIEYQRSPVPDDAAEWLAGRDWLEAGPIESVSIGGVEAAAFDFRVLDVDDDLFTDEFGDVGPLLFGIPGGGYFFLLEGALGRLWVVSLDDAALLIHAEVHEEGDADEFLATARAVVESMRFG